MGGGHDSLQSFIKAVLSLAFIVGHETGPPDGGGVPAGTRCSRRAGRCPTAGSWGSEVCARLSIGSCVLIWELGSCLHSRGSLWRLLQVTGLIVSSARIGKGEGKSAGSLADAGHS